MSKTSTTCPRGERKCESIPPQDHPLTAGQVAHVQSFRGMHVQDGVQDPWAVRRALCESSSLPSLGSPCSRAGDEAHDSPSGKQDGVLRV
jgi:hypothetical protein